MIDLLQGNRDAGFQEAECEKAAMDVKYSTDAKIENKWYDWPLLQANRDAGIREAECEKAAMDVKYSTDTKIEDNSRAFKLQKANFDMEVNTAVSWKTILKNICLCENERWQILGHYKA
jgi:hypothetical protein